MSIFDPDSFLSTQVTEKMASHYTPIPEDEYQATIASVTPREPKEGMRILDIIYNVMVDEQVRQRIGLPDNPTVRQSIFLDLTPSGGLAFGPNRNVKLGKLREAVGQNTGKPWSPLMLVGAGPLLVKVKHRIDQDDPDMVYTEVSRTAPLR